jgi:hypothetical protein
MGVPTSEVGYTSATAGRGDHEVDRDMWWHWQKLLLLLLLLLLLCTLYVFYNCPIINVLRIFVLFL